METVVAEQIILKIEKLRGLLWDKNFYFTASWIGETLPTVKDYPRDLEEFWEELKPMYKYYFPVDKYYFPEEVE